LATEHFAKAAFAQYRLPYTIARPFNCAGIGEARPLMPADYAGQVGDLAQSHVIPDLVAKILSGQNPLRILGSGNQVRHFTYGADLARGIRLCIESPAALKEDFNLSTREATSVLDLARLIWKKVHGSARPFRFETQDAYEHDVQMRAPDVSKAERLLGFRAETSLSEILDEVIPWIAGNSFAQSTQHA
jgi:nucleoside-diphosphate-sugar epimerase